MVFLFNGIPSSNVNVTSGITGRSLTIVRSTRTSNGTTNMLTVPANKKARVYFAQNTYGAGGGYISQISANSNEIAGYLCTAATYYVSQTFNSVNYIELSTGQTVDFTVTSYASGTAIAILGYELLDV